MNEYKRIARITRFVRPALKSQSKVDVASRWKGGGRGSRTAQFALSACARGRIVWVALNSNWLGFPRGMRSCASNDTIFILATHTHTDRLTLVVPFLLHISFGAYKQYMCVYTLSFKYAVEIWKLWWANRMCAPSSVVEWVRWTGLRFWSGYTWWTVWSSVGFGCPSDWG